MHTIPKLVIRDDGHCPLFLVPCKYEEPVGGSSLERGPSFQALRQKLWSLSIQAKSGKRNIAPLLSAPLQTTPQKKNPTQNSRLSFYSDWNDLLNRTHISCFTPISGGKTRNTVYISVKLATLMWRSDEILTKGYNLKISNHNENYHHLLCCNFFYCSVISRIKC